MNENMNIELKNETMREDSFMEKLLKKRLNQKGLTLIELLAVIVILAIVAAIAIPAIGNLIDNSRVGAVKGDAVNVLNAANLYFTENSDETSVALASLTTAGYIESAGELTSATVTKRQGASNTITAAADTGGITFTFTNATVEEINDFPNSQRNADGNVVITGAATNP